VKYLNVATNKVYTQDKYTKDVHLDCSSFNEHMLLPVPYRGPSIKSVDHHHSPINDDCVVRLVTQQAPLVVLVLVHLYQRGRLQTLDVFTAVTATRGLQPALTNLKQLWVCLQYLTMMKLNLMVK